MKPANHFHAARHLVACGLQRAIGRIAHGVAQVAPGKFAHHSRHPILDVARGPVTGQRRRLRPAGSRQIGDRARLDQPKTLSVIGPLDVLRVLPFAQCPLHPLRLVDQFLFDRLRQPGGARAGVP